MKSESQKKVRLFVQKIRRDSRDNSFINIRADYLMNELLILIRDVRNDILEQLKHGVREEHKVLEARINKMESILSGRAVVNATGKSVEIYNMETRSKQGGNRAKGRMGDTDNASVNQSSGKKVCFSQEGAAD